MNREIENIVQEIIDQRKMQIRLESKLNENGGWTTQPSLNSKTESIIIKISECTSLIYKNIDKLIRILK